jgi:hypothetical protein
MQRFSALGSIQHDSETSRLAAESFLRKVLRIGCSMRFSLTDAANECNDELRDLKIGKSFMVQQGIDRIVSRDIKLPVTVHVLKRYLLRKIPMAGMVRRLVIAKDPRLGNWVGAVQCDRYMHVYMYVYWI